LAIALLFLFELKYIKINNDVFDIANRIKSIDSKYFVLFNLKNKKYEVHYQRAKNTYELTLPFDTLDARAICYVQKTRVENKEKLFAEIEKQNQKLMEEKQKEQIKNLQRSVYAS